MKRKISGTSIDKALDFICEAGMLKQVRRSGWSVLGIRDAESVADHSFRCVVIGYILAHMEKVSPHKVMLMTLFNDIQEARITDLHKMAQRYIDGEMTEDRAFYEQIKYLPKDIKKELIDVSKEYRNQRTKESIISRDADILECLIQAKEYYTHGHREATKFMKKAPGFLKTKSARELWRLAKAKDINNWWFKLSGFKR
ncbi:MAG: HAD family hydrolase [Candidatus Omnitrophica bacterium CG07_land_8_20_14_0_80_42_15]|uniref:HAD family hydrolase n=1 Tax=Candidatus Aquitaenariimonas noxiae TaxID=1974741 RepID=A0A2J0KUM3_9BACT|nr:MAG: HAD family hydrolase [Candidatus Omnitrophica bacterium CG07_land_8_20_14_0_80_42_15]